MRAAIALFLACVLALGYEIRHENEGKIYKFAGEADGSKFELYISELEAEFENFSDKGVVLPPKFQGHAFFEGARYDFSKGSIEKSGADITAVNAVTEWLNLSVKADNGELTGKLAIKGKARKAVLKQVASYDFAALGLQEVGRDTARDLRPSRATFTRLNLRKITKNPSPQNLQILKRHGSKTPQKTPQTR